MPLITDGNGQSKIRQGVTTEVIGESGSVAPRKAASATANWTDFTGYFAAIEKGGISPNLLSYVGTGTVREMVIGEDDKQGHGERHRRHAADRVVDDGPGRLRRVVRPDLSAECLRERRRARRSRQGARKGGLYASHLRYDGLKLRDGIEEAIAIGERAGIPVHVFHIKVTGQKNFGRMKEVIELVEAARARGVRVTADQYPYVASSTSLTATIPPWAQDGGTDKLIARLKDKQERARIRKEMENTNPTWESRYQSAGTWQNVQLAAIGRTRGGTERSGVAESQVRRHARRRSGEAGRQGSVRLRLRSAD